jgi:hypothetical protein
MDEQTYILALRSKLQKPTIFLKQNLKNIHANTYGRFIDELWEANIDLHNSYWIHMLQQVIVHLI